jgi:hypothetical protein
MFFALLWARGQRLSARGDSEMPKKRGFGFCLSLLVLALGTMGSAQEKQSFKPGFHIKLTGGPFQAAIGDMNTHLGSMDGYYRRYYQSEGSGEIRRLGWSSEWQMELLWDASSKIRWGLATHFSRLKNESTFLGAYVQEYRIDHEIVFRPQIDVVAPLRLSVYYSVYSNRKINILLHSGFGVYSAKMKEEHIRNFIYPDGDVYYDNRSWSVKSRPSFGLHGGVSAEYGLGRNLALVAELQGRYLKINDLRGSVKYTTNFGMGWPIVEGGSLHFFAMGEDYYDLDIPLPAHAMVYGLPQYLERKAVLNLSGLSFRVGIRVRVF